MIAHLLECDDCLALGLALAGGLLLAAYLYWSDHP